MPEPFKNLFSRDLIAGLADHLAARDPDFDRAGFEFAASDGLETLELKARSAQITAALEAYLSLDFATACAHLTAALHPDDDVDLSGKDMDAAGVRGWAVMPMADFVAARGAADFDLAMRTLEEMTKRFTSEGAVRPFIAADQPRAFEYLHRWAQSDNFHVRRLASEGARPRLPWNMQLTALIADPAPLPPLLERLRDDPVEYVRRSVANNLNDIAKDHPDLAAGIAADWLEGASKERARLVRHACRTLIKRGHASTLVALGFGPAKVSLAQMEIATPTVSFGETLEFEAEIVSDADVAQDIVLDYVIHHRKANGTTSPKVFKWKTLSLPPRGKVKLRRKHAMRPITTRVYYDGGHRVDLVANGATLGGAGFELTGAEAARKG